MVSDDRGRLFTLSFPLDDRLLGTVHVYPQDEAFAYLAAAAPAAGQGRRAADRVPADGGARRDR